jgi:CheY-like chemotaxis protein
MDVEMPQQDGIVTTRNILNYYQSSQEKRRIPIIVGCSGYESQGI